MIQPVVSDSGGVSQLAVPLGNRILSLRKATKVVRRKNASAVHARAGPAIAPFSTAGQNAQQDWSPQDVWFAKAVWSLHLADREKSWEKHCFPERGRKVGRWEPSQGVEKLPSLPSLGFLPPSGSECLSFKLYLTEFLSENTSARIF